jgi:hypothetical protein
MKIHGRESFTIIKGLVLVTEKLSVLYTVVGSGQDKMLFHEVALSAEG